jgi:hypothetical protein
MDGYQGAPIRQPVVAMSYICAGKTGEGMIPALDIEHVTVFDQY